MTMLKERMNVSNKRLDHRAKQAQRLKLQGLTNKEIAEMMNTSPRTISRYLNHDLEEPVVGDLALLPPALRDEWLALARPQMLGAMADLEERRLAGKLSNRDLILLYQNNFANIARLTPPEEEKAGPEYPLLRVTVSCPQAPELLANYHPEVVEDGEVVEEATEQIIEGGEVVEEEE